jgi:hypothetical protein
VDIQGSLRCDIEERRRQEHAVSGDHHGVWAGSAQTRERLRGFQRLRLKDFQAMSGCEALDGTGRELLTAARGAIRLGEHQSDVMAGLVQSRKRSLREFRSAGKN